ncbi:MAG: PEP-CTERM sorting domain-containing protein [Rubrivivax sp.]|nr:PEP-CTERM sorting domain-containing protein [Rubrivivax sp.]
MSSLGYTGPPLLTYAAQGASTVLNNLVNLYSHAYADSLTSKDKATAFGYVVWEIMGDSINGSSRTSGALQSKGTNQSNPDTVDAQIDAYLLGLSGGSWGTLTTVQTYTYSVLYNSGNNPNHVGQNFLRVSNPGGGNQGTGNIPEPGTIALAGLALLGTFRASRRKAVVA